MLSRSKMDKKSFYQHCMNFKKTFVRDDWLKQLFFDCSIIRDLWAWAGNTKRDQWLALSPSQCAEKNDAYHVLKWKHKGWCSTHPSPAGGPPALTVSALIVISFCWACENDMIAREEKYDAHRGTVCLSWSNWELIEKSTVSAHHLPLPIALCGFHIAMHGAVIVCAKEIGKIVQTALLYKSLSTLPLRASKQSASAFRSLVWRWMSTYKLPRPHFQRDQILQQNL